MTHSKRHALLCIIIFFLPITIVGGVTYIVDPFQIYRPQQFVTPMFFAAQRYQNAGKINSYLLQDGYDAVILGHSQTDNFLPSKVAKHLGWKRVMKLTMSGGTPTEEAIVLARALSKGSIRHVLWGVGFSYTADLAEAWNKKRVFPRYFYTDTIMDDARYLFGLDSFMKSIHLLSGNLDSSWNSNLETLNYWMTNREISYIKFNSNKNIRKLAKKRKRALSVDVFSESNTSNHYAAAESNLIPLIKDHPEVNFIIYFPPHFRGLYPDFIISYSHMQQYLVQRCADYSNVAFYGFSDNNKITANAANFRDPMHYHSGVNLFMLKRIANNMNRLTVDNIENYVQRVQDLAVRYTVYSNMKNMIPMAKKSEYKTFQKLLRDMRRTKRGKT